MQASEHPKNGEEPVELKRPGRFGVATRLAIGLGLVAALATVSATHGTLSFSRVEDAFASVSRDHLPSLHESANIARHSQVLSSVAPEYLNASSKEQLLEARARREQVSRDLKAAFARLSGFDLPRETLHDLEMRISLIVTNLEKIDRIVENSLIQKQRLSTLRDEMVAFNNEISTTGFINNDPAAIRTFHQWNESFRKAFTGGMAALAMESRKELDTAETRTLERIADLQTELQKLTYSPEMRNLQSRWLSRLSRLAIGEEGAHHVQRQLVSANLSLREILEVNRDVTNGLGTSLDVLTKASASQVGQATRAFQESFASSGRMGLAILAVSLVSIFLIIFWVFRSVLRRLMMLETAMRSYVDGEKGPVPELGNDEIGSMGRALKVFLNRIDSREAKLKASESRLIAQNNALRALSRSAALNSGRFRDSLKEIAETASQTLEARRVCIWLTPSGRLDRLERVLAFDRSPEHKSDPDLLSPNRNIIDLVDYPRYFEALTESETLAVQCISKEPLLAEFSPAYWQTNNITCLINATVRVRGILHGIVSIEDDASSHSQAPEQKDDGCPDGQRAWTADEISFASSMAAIVERCMLDQERRQAETDLITANHERRKAGEALSHTRSMLETSERMATLGSLVGSVTHEVNTPIGIILTAASHLNSKTQQFQTHLVQNSIKRSDMMRYLEQVAEAGQLIAANSNRAGELIQSLKHVSSEQATNRRTRFDLKQELTNIAFSLGPLFNKTPHKLEIEGPTGVMMDSFPGALSQVVTNIVTNALKHAFSPDMTGKVAITFCRKAVQESGSVPDDLEGDVELVFTDNGMGMEPDFLKTVFDPYVTSKPDDGGTGLGLYIVNKLIQEELYGKIDIKSAPGEGTTFRIIMPCSPPKPELPSGATD